MKINMLVRAREIWFHEYCDTEQARYNAVAWAKAIRYLGDRWLLATPVERTTK